MTSITIHPGKTVGSISAPPSKSQTMRALLWAMMADGQSTIERVLPSPDTQAMIRATSALGASIISEDNHLLVRGVSGQPRPNGATIDAGNSGQVLRFIPPLAALSSEAIIVTGDHSICTSRPVQPMLDALTMLGATCTSTHGHAPIRVQGKIRSGQVQIEGSDSQGVSGLIMAAAFMQGTTQIQVLNAGEKPWVGLTLSWLDRFNIGYKQKDFSYYEISGGASVNAFHYQVPGDFSSIAFPVVAALITGGQLEIHGLDRNDAQGDKQLLAILTQMGADIEWGETLVVRGGNKLHGCEINANDIIDAVPILAVLGCVCNGETILFGAQIARYKECDRLHSITVELRKMGADIEEFPDGLRVRPGELHGCRDLQTYADHRIAMALSVAALIAKSSSTIHGVSCVNKSYPEFFSILSHLGVDIERNIDRV